MSFKEISLTDLNENVFNLIGNDWMLITAKDSDGVNTMTASWGGLGVLWNKNVSYIFIRPERYTKKFVDNSEYFSLTFFDEKFKDKLLYLGKASGKNEDKIKESGFELSEIDNIPMFTEARIVLICKKLYSDEIKESSFVYDETIKTNYPNNDFHTLYISEITKILIKE
ncbi:flavin reductase [Sedimentibacter sp. zth1]|uniref:flavin reductase n=1 Tax=Sedimentibacter sp. zth1 TaxID=2816908 RepID=UPI001A90D0D5|nr:flavin reductase [Sedimentibacter sp. zth1]QSX05811.1 flavin reductase [Sedimentibacter sp. zth1]